MLNVLERPANLHDFEFPKDNNRKHTLILGNLATHLFGDSREEVDLASRSSTSIFDSCRFASCSSRRLLTDTPPAFRCCLADGFISAVAVPSRHSPAENHVSPPKSEHVS